MVPWDVLLLVVALAGVDETVVQSPALVEERQHGRTTVPRNIRDLVPVICVCGIRDIYRLLVSVLESGRGLHLAESPGRVQGDVNPLDVHLSEIEHRPTELLTFRVGYDLVRDVVVVGVHGSVDSAQSGHIHKILGVFQSDVELLGVFRLQEGIAHIRVVEVVERRHPEHPLVERAH